MLDQIEEAGYEPAEDDMDRDKDVRRDDMSR